MPDLADGESIQVRGSGSSVYTIKNVGGVFSCSCPAWCNQSAAIELRTCKHIRRLRGEEAEAQRVGTAAASPPRAKRNSDDDSGATEPPLLLAEAWDGATDVDGWWLSEKLDGVRAYWDGTQFLSRFGNRYAAPAWFTEGLPKEPLDGELWLDRKQFQRTVSIVRRQDQSEHWRQIRYVVFDLPAVAEPFEQRLTRLSELFREFRGAFAAAHPHQRCRGTAHLQEELQRIESLGGEGLMLRQPASLYVAGRSTTLLKVKTFHNAEAVVIGHQPGAGRHKGRLGALLVKLLDGTEFSVGTGFSDAQRERPPAIGAQITFRYQELSDAGVPRFPTFAGVRNDGSSSTAKSPPQRERQPQAPATAAPTEVTAASATSTRCFTFRDATSDKFWEITVNGTEVAVRYGRQGSKGQFDTKTFADAEAAHKHADALIQKKTKKGYVKS